MLKALELIGFKSFADKTRFEFPPGITVIVGPNGSGKSNIVDAIKWVLGEQSAKSLRGKDMADVIFKGSGDGGRKMVNTAEATIIFDNSAGQLAIDAPEVHVTRRVYRSGEGEYLINGQPCRLKDIRSLFRGTGVGSDAYSLIEQGKVDQMLQASPRERRSIFEEAAGISRFKAKKIEAQRRLERVEQNLLRLSDIVEEVDSRLRSVRSQATKARRYREYRDRLQQLRTHVGLSDWRQLTSQLDAIEAEGNRLRETAAEQTAQAESLEAQILELDVGLAAAAEAIRRCASRAGHNREQIAARESSIEPSRLHCRQLEEAAARDRRQLCSMTERTGDLQQRLRDTRSSLRQAELIHGQAADRAAERAATLQARTRELDAIHAQAEWIRKEHLERIRAVAVLGNRIGTLESQRENWRHTAERAGQSTAEAVEAVNTCREELTLARELERELRHQVEAVTQSLEAAKQRVGQTRLRRTEQRGLQAGLQQRLSAATERVKLLDELDRNYEGLGLGVRDALELARAATQGPFAEIRGLVADLIQASVDIAPLVDVALGEKAQHVVVEGACLLEEIQSGHYQPGGRVGFVAVDDAIPPPAATSLEGLPGVLGRLDTLVYTDERLRPMVRRLIGETWCVDSLATACELRPTAPLGCRFVTTAGELVDSDGARVVGARTSLAGLVSRRSELRAKKQEAAELEQASLSVQAELAALEQAAQQQAEAVEGLEQDLRHGESGLADQRARIHLLGQRLEDLQRQQQAAENELREAEARCERATSELEVSRLEVVELERQLSGSEEAIRSLEQQAAELTAQREEAARGLTAVQIELAKSEQQVESLRSSLRQLGEVEQERSRALFDSRGQLELCLQRLVQTERDILRATSELALLYLGKESLEREARQASRERDSQAADRARLLDRLQSVRQQVRHLEERRHQTDLEAGTIRHQRSTLADRLREDYDIEIGELQTELTPQELAAREEVEQEIAELRRKLNNIGAVNLDALAELDELENRFGSLSNQYHDLRQAKESLERIINRINSDSRRLFQETLEAIRANFQALYRRAFGGGRADLLLEEGVDPLEAGVDIIATPPGKPSFSNSLLSGGEKALTAVSLLLAIFQYRPSPFCVLDEVDAPFDEANIGRFIEVLRGFLGWTRFVVVTHSKKTMTAATTLYGVTMQESGVSKRVSVRFEDVTDDGHIRDEAVAREASETQEIQRGAA